METVVLNAEPREAVNSPENRRLRKKGLVPANIYGAGIEGSVLVQFVRREIEPLITRVATAIDAEGKNPREEIEFIVKLGDKEYKTRLGELQRDVIRREFTHLDFIVKG
jgi:ribosomal protein L25 (general stress protein Ctc)